MLYKVRDISMLLNEYAPLNRAYEWDNSGLLMGRPDKDVKTIMVALDVTPLIVKDAVKQNVDMIVSHHPVIFKEIKSIVQDNWHSNMIAELIKNDIAVYSAHTNLDIAKGGVNDVLATILDLKDVCILDTIGYEKTYKLAVYVPEQFHQNVLDSMCAKGAGFIGKYSSCTFNIRGKGTFKPLSGSNPFIGSTDVLETVDEIKLETMVKESNKHSIIDAMLEAHPYEEVAYDLYELKNNINSWGIGRLGLLSEKMDIKDFAKYVKNKLNLDFVLYTDAKKSIQKVAVCSGAGSDLLKAAIKSGADVFVSGDIKYHFMQEAKFSGMNVVDAGHQGSEIIVVDEVCKYLKTLSGGLNIIKATEEVIIKCL